MGFKETIRKAREKYEQIKTNYEVRQVQKRERELETLKKETSYFKAKADHQRQINRYEKLKKSTADLKQKAMQEKAKNIENRFKRFEGGGLNF